MLENMSYLNVKKLSRCKVYRTHKTGGEQKEIIMKRIIVLVLVGLMAVTLRAEDKELPEQASEKAKVAMRKVKVKLGEDIVEFDLNKRDTDFDKGVFIKKEKKIKEIPGYGKEEIEYEVQGFASRGGGYGVKLYSKVDGYNDEVEYYDENGNNKWKIEKPYYSIWVKRVSNNGK